MVEIQNMTSIAEVSFAMNSVLGYLILQYREVNLKSIKAIYTQTISEEFSSFDNCFIFKNGNKFSKKEFGNIQNLFKITLSLSVIAILVSFSILYFSAITPEYKLSTWIYTLASIVFLLVNPIIYFTYKIKIDNFNIILDGKNIKNDEMTSFMANYISIPVYDEKISQKLYWFFHFKKKVLIFYLKKIFKKKP